MKFNTSTLITGTLIKIKLDQIYSEYFLEKEAELKFIELGKLKEYKSLKKLKS